MWWIAFGWMDGWMDAWVDACMHTYAWMDDYDDDDDDDDGQPLPFDNSHAYM